MVDKQLIAHILKNFTSPPMRLTLDVDAFAELTLVLLVCNNPGKVATLILSCPLRSEPPSPPSPATVLRMISTVTGNGLQNSIKR